MDYLQTYTGKKFFILNPTVDSIDIIDIAHALSLLCRYNGHCRTFYSVGQHAVWVANIIKHLGGTVDDQLYGLHHDASESFITDIPRPVKPHLNNYLELEKKISDVIYEHFNIKQTPAKHELMKRADNIALAMEYRDLMNKSDTPWVLDEKPLPIRIEPLQPKVVEKLYLKKHRELMEAL